MAIVFTPQSEEEINSELLLPLGAYAFEVLQATDKISRSSQKPMIELVVEVFDWDGGSRQIKDYLTPEMKFKLRHFCVHTGLAEWYHSGQLTAEMCAGRQGICKLGVDRDKTGDFLDRNKIVDYLAPETPPGPLGVAAAAPPPPAPPAPPPPPVARHPAAPAPARAPAYGAPRPAQPLPPARRGPPAAPAPAAPAAAPASQPTPPGYVDPDDVPF